MRGPMDGARIITEFMIAGVEPSVVTAALCVQPTVAHPIGTRHPKTGKAARRHMWILRLEDGALDADQQVAALLGKIPRDAFARLAQSGGSDICVRSIAYINSGTYPCVFSRDTLQLIASVGAYLYVDIYCISEV